MSTEWASIKQDCDEIDELSLDDEIKADLFQRIYIYIRAAEAFLRIYGKEEEK